MEYDESIATGRFDLNFPKPEGADYEYSGKTPFYQRPGWQTE